MSIVPPGSDSKSNSPRRAITKRVRYEVLNRDGNACHYCGGRPPEVRLVLDHVLPVSLGGTDEPSNLRAACTDCNSGKASSHPNAATVAQVSEDALRWAAAMKSAADRMASHKAEVAAHLKPWFDQWELRSGMGWSYKLPADADQVLTDYLAAGMPLDVLMEAARVALQAAHIDQRFRYFRGVANNMLAELQRDATQILTAQEGSVEIAAADQDASIGWDNRPWRKGYLKALEHIRRAESGDPIYWESAQVSAFQYGALAMVVDGQAADWAVSR